MNECQRCASDQIIRISGKCNDLCQVQYPDGEEHRGYLPSGLAVGSGDYIKFSYCRFCGQIQGDFS